MSGYTVINAASLAVRRVLWEAYESDPVLRPIVGSEAAIVLVNPTEALEDSTNRISLWLYQVSENEFLKNRPPLRESSADLTVPPLTRYPPLALNLHYLITPLGPSADADHMLLGRTLETLYNTTTLVLRDGASGVAEEIRIIFCRQELDEIAHVWEALQKAYRLSVCYELKIAQIDARRIPEDARVLERSAVFPEIEAAAA